MNHSAKALREMFPELAHQLETASLKLEAEFHPEWPVDFAGTVTHTEIVAPLGNKQYLVVEPNYVSFDGIPTWGKYFDMVDRATGEHRFRQRLITKCTIVHEEETVFVFPIEGPNLSSIIMEGVLRNSQLNQERELENP